MKLKLDLEILLFILFTSRIATNIIEDIISSNLTIKNSLSTLVINKTHQSTATYRNLVGIEETISLKQSSSETSIRIQDNNRSTKTSH